MSYKTSLFSIFIHSFVFAAALLYLNQIDAFKNLEGISCTGVRKPCGNKCCGGGQKCVNGACYWK
jgi:hypothetical protein